MNEIMKDNSDFVGYDYMQVVTNSEKVSFLIDAYENFGWIIDHNVYHNTSDHKPNVNSNVTLRLKRNRKIINKMELTRLQKNFESCIKDIDHLEQSKTSSATMYSIMVGIAGTAFMTGSVFAVTSNPPLIWLCILLAIPALVGWIAPYFLYHYIVKKRTVKLTPFIEEKKDEVYELCEKGNKLIQN